MKWQYIAKQEDLDVCVDFLKQVKAFAIDLEFDKNRYRYGFNLCLMQLFAEGQCFIVDPLNDNLDVKVLFPVLENPAIEKVVFSFGEDLRLLHSLGCLPQNTFDIAIAMRLLDYPPCSLTNAVLDLLDIELSKASQKSNWFSRPLSEKQLEYAATDVLYLFDLKAILDEQAQKTGVTDWIAEENAVFDSVDYSDLDNSNYLKEKDKKDLSEVEFYIFKNLLEFRESIAEKMNRPSYQVMDKDYLKELAERPNQIHRFHKIKGLHKSLKNDAFKEELWAKRQRFEKEAEQAGLSPTEKAMKRLSSEEYQLYKKQRSERDEVKRKVFKPIQALISQNHGENIVTYILGNRMMDELAMGDTANLRTYKRMLIERYANELGLDVSPFLDGV